MKRVWITALIVLCFLHCGKGESSVRKLKSGLYEVRVEGGCASYRSSNDRMQWMLDDIYEVCSDPVVRTWENGVTACSEAKAKFSCPEGSEPYKEAPR